MGSPRNSAAFIALGAAAEDKFIIVDSVDLMIDLNAASQFMQSGGLNRELVYVGTQHH